MNRRLGGAGRRNIRGSTPRSLEAQITAIYAQASWTVPLIFLARGGDVSLVSGAVERWLNRGSLGSAADAVQAVGAARPTFNAASINSRPSLGFDGGDLLATASFALAGTALVQHVLFLDTISAAAIVVERSVNAANNNGGHYVTTGEIAGTVRFLGTGNALNSIVDSSAETMATAHVITGTWDQSLATNETEIRRDGINFTNARTSNQNTTGGFGSHAFFIGGRSSISSPTTGQIAAVILAAGATEVPLTAAASVEALLKTQWTTP